MREKGRFNQIKGMKIIEKKAFKRILIHAGFAPG
jgi:hypothetical protein